MPDEEKESEVVKALKEEYEKRLKEQKEQYENKLKEQKEDYTNTIKTILSTGAVYKEESDIAQKEEESEEDTIVKNLRKKFKLYK